MDTPDPIHHLVSATVELGLALKALEHRTAGMPTPPLCQDGTEHLDEIRALARLIKHLLQD